MGYEIQYEWMGKARHITAAKKWLRYAGLFCMIVFACILILWTMGGDWSVTADALEGMATDLQNGVEIKEAFNAFCLEVIHGA